jgi:integrase
MYAPWQSVTAITFLHLFWEIAPPVSAEGEREKSNGSVCACHAGAAKTASGLGRFGDAIRSFRGFQEQKFSSRTRIHLLISARLPTVLTPDQLKEFLSRLIDPAKTAVLLGAVTGLRAGELLGLKWSDIDFEKLEIRLIRDVVKQRIERCKTEASKKPIPIDAALAEALWSRRLHCAYNQEDDWVFASNQVSGRQPDWPSSLYRVYMRPALEAMGITEPVGWHTLRHSFGTLMKANGEDAKTIQELLRYANFKVTMDVYTQAVTEAKTVGTHPGSATDSRREGEGG